MELKYSGTGTPYIDLDNGMLIFSKTTETEKGFTYLVLRSKQVSSICVSGAKAKRKKYVNMQEDIGYTFDMNLKKDSGGKKTGIPRDARFCFSKLTENVLKKILNKLTTDGYFPRERLHDLSEALESYYGSETDDWDDDPTATESYDDIGENGEEKKPPKRKLTLAKKPKRKLKLARPKSIIKGNRK